MSRRLKTWSLLGGATLMVAAISLTTLVLTRSDRRTDTAAGEADHEARQDGRLTAAETWRAEHDTLTRPLVDRFYRVERKQDAMLIWMRLVSKIEGWPLPPEPASLPLPRDPGPGLYAADTPDTYQTYRSPGGTCP